MSILESLQKRRTYYSINGTLPVSKETVEDHIMQLTELVPDAYNMKSSRVAVAFEKANKKLWNNIYDAFGGKVSRAKIDSFSAGAGTILYFIDDATVRTLQSKFPSYSDNFPLWALQASAMLQLSIWSDLREMNIGASLQHYNPVIDDAVIKQFGLPESYRLVAQMPFGGISEEPALKEREDISKRVLFFK